MLEVESILKKGGILTTFESKDILHVFTFLATDIDTLLFVPTQPHNKVEENTLCMIFI